MTTSSSHLKALLRKNYIIWKRNWICSLLEILIPVLFAFVFAIFRAASPVETLSQTSYYNEPYTYAGVPSAAALKLIKNCNAGQNGGSVALAPAGDSIVNSLETLFQGNYGHLWYKY